MIAKLGSYIFSVAIARIAEALGTRIASSPSMAAFAEIKHEWRQFKDDRPGERFDNHRKRMDEQPTWHKVLRGAGGFALIALGIVFCILPGPGTVGIALGLALLAGMSKTIAHGLDRLEPRMRRGLASARAFWQGLSTGRRALLVSCASAVVALGVVVVWRGWVGPMVASYLG